MIVEVVVRVSADDDLGVLGVGSAVERHLSPISARLVSIVQKFETVPGRPPEARDRAMDWLRFRLVSGRQVSATTVYDDAAKAGMSPKTLKRAAEDLGVVKVPAGGGRTCKWRLPKNRQEVLS